MKKLSFSIPMSVLMVSMLIGAAFPVYAQESMTVKVVPLTVPVQNPDLLASCKAQRAEARKVFVAAKQEAKMKYAEARKNVRFPGKRSLYHLLHSRQKMKKAV